MMVQTYRLMTGIIILLWLVMGNYNAVLGQIKFIDSGQRLGNSASVSVALGDVDGDGDLDAFVGNFNSPNEVWLNNGAGIFSKSIQSIGSNAFSVALGDVDGDGDLDAFCGNIGDALVYPAPDTVYFNNGAGVFTDSGQRLGNTASVSIALGDLDSDGDLDVFIGNFRDTQNISANRVWWNNGAGLFSDSGQRLGSAATLSVALGDLDSDGDLDAFVSKSPRNEVWLNNGSGLFVNSGQSLGGSGNWPVALGDLDSDSDFDAFIGKTGSASNLVFLNNGFAVFSDSGQSLGNLSTQAVALGDLDSDGDLDAFIGNWNEEFPDQSNANQVFVNNGAGVFTDSGLSLGNSSTMAVALGDLDGDGDLDAFVANDQGAPNEVWWNVTSSVVLIELTDFTASPGNKTIIIQWSTASEIDNAGFNIYRAKSENGPYEKINTSLISAIGSSTQGASYEYIDKDVKNRKTCYYKLEDIDLNGQSTMHGPVSATPRWLLGIFSIFGE